jgi:phenylalanyl-tRNA synthetase beta chain
MSVMRSSLIGGLVGALAYNLNRMASRVRVFEIGRVFRRDAAIAEGPLTVGGIAQPNCVGGLAYGLCEDEQWGSAARDVDFHDVKGDVERLLVSVGAAFVPAPHPALHPGRSAVIEVQGRRIGVVGELHPRLQQKFEFPKAPIVFELDPTVRRPCRAMWKFRGFPPVSDISIIVDDALPVQSIIDVVRSLSRTDGRLSALRDFRLFDVYRPRPDSSKITGASANALLIKEKSLAFRVVLQDTGRSLNDADADAALGVIIEGLEQRCGARLRQ